MVVDLYSYDIPMEDWLWYMINSKYILTNSFHASCFGVIFDKDFSVILEHPETETRFDYLRELGLGDTLFNSFDEFCSSELSETKINRTDCKVILEKERQKSINWLKNAISAPKETKNRSISDNLLDAIIDNYEEEIYKTNLRINNIADRISFLENKYKNSPKNKRKFYHNIFSVVNQYRDKTKHKVITILGVKVKLKSK